RARARALVADSGTRGDQVTAYGGIANGTVCTGVIPYAVRVLRELGYRAQAHFVPRASLSNVDWSAVQIGCFGAEDFQPADFLSIFRCSSPANNDWFCDRRLDADVQRARALEGTAPSPRKRFCRSSIGRSPIARSSSRSSTSTSTTSSRRG